MGLLLKFTITKYVVLVCRVLDKITLSIAPGDFLTRGVEEKIKKFHKYIKKIS